MNLYADHLVVAVLLALIAMLFAQIATLRTRIERLSTKLELLKPKVSPKVDQPEVMLDPARKYALMQSLLRQRDVVPGDYELIDINQSSAVSKS